MHAIDEGKASPGGMGITLIKASVLRALHPPGDFTSVDVESSVQVKYEIREVVSSSMYIHICDRLREKRSRGN